MPIKFRIFIYLLDRAFQLQMLCFHVNVNVMFQNVNVSMLSQRCKEKFSNENVLICILNSILNSIFNKYVY